MRIHGRHGRFYFAPDESSNAQPVSGTTKWTINAQTDFVDATAQGDLSKVSLAGLPGSEFNFEGLYDSAAFTGNIFAAAISGTARKAYFYPDVRDNTKYFFGTAFASGSLSSGVTESTTVSGQGAFATSMISVGID